MDGSRNVGNGWQPMRAMWSTGMRAMDGNQECGQWMATGMRAMDGNQNAGNGWQPECGQWMATRM